MNSSRITFFTVRIVIVAFWLVLFAFFLLTARLTGFLQPKKTISVLTWGQVIDPLKVAEFEKQTGIVVYLNYFESNEELLGKLQLSGYAGYDLLTPSDYMVKRLIKDGRLKRIEREKAATLLTRIKPELLGHYHDPHNEYSIPLLWEVYGIGVDLNSFGNQLPPAHWDLLFNMAVAPDHIGMLNNPRDVILIAARYLFGTIDDLDNQKLQAIQNLLIKQKKKVELYTDLRADYVLASGVSPVVLMPSSSMIKPSYLYSYLKFIVPRDSFMLIDSLVIPASSTKEDLVYQFIDFVLRPEIARYHFELFGYLPSVDKTLTPAEFTRLGLDKVSWKDLDFFRTTVPFSDLHEIWLRLKAI